MKRVSTRRKGIKLLPENRAFYRRYPACSLGGRTLFRAQAVSLRAPHASRTSARTCSRLHFEGLVLRGQGDRRGQHAPRGAEGFPQEQGLDGVPCQGFDLLL